MTMRWRFLPVLVLAACGGPTRPGPEQPAPPSVRTTPEAIARARADSVTRPYTQADVDFMTGMIAHHAQALVMAAWADTHGASSQVRTLAGRIVNGQQDEIALMQQWLADREKPVPQIGEHMHHAQAMPGMLTEAQLRQLDAARGREFDRLFLTLMIQHHQGAVTMVKRLFGTTGAAQDLAVFKLASAVHVDQVTEIARMEQMLTSFTPQGN